MKYIYSVVVRLSLSLCLILSCAAQSTAQLHVVTHDTTVCANAPFKLKAVKTNGRTPTYLTLGDDYYSDTISIGFNFNFYGVNYKKCVISSNGFICFDTTLALAYSPWSIGQAVPGNTACHNAVMADYCDIFPLVGGTIDYATVGTAPNRKFVVSFCDVPMYSCTDLKESFQMILNETTNDVEFHLARKTLCSTWNSGAAIEGVQDPTSTYATVVSGRNYPAQWSTNYSSHKFTEASATNYTYASIPYALIPNLAAPVLWYDDSNKLVGTGDSIFVSPSRATRYYARVFNCADSFSDSEYVRVVPPIKAGFSYSVNYGCTADTVVFMDSTQNAGNYPITDIWKYGDNTTGGGSPSTHVYTIQAVDTVVLIANTSLCTDTTKRTIDLRHPLKADFTILRDSICQNQQSLQIVNNSIGTRPMYFWDFGDGSTDTSFLPVHYFKTYGQFTVKLKVTDFVPCMDSVSHDIIIQPQPQVFITPHDTTACLADSLQLNSKVYPSDFTAYNYLWSPNNNGLSDVNIPNPKFFATDYYRYQFVLTVQTPFGCAGSDTAYIQVRPIAHLVNVTTDTTIKYGNSVQLNAEGGYTYTWSPDATLNNGNVSNPVATPLVNTIYTVYGFNVYGCEDSAQVKVFIDYKMNEYIPSAFSPNGDGRNDVFRIFNMRYQKLVEFRVFNRWGKDVFSTTNPEDGWDGKVNGVPQDAGVYYYIIKVTRPDGKDVMYKGDVTLVR